MPDNARQGENHERAPRMERGELLLSMRERRRLTQEALAAESGVSLSTIQRLENKPEADSRRRTIRSIAEVFGEPDGSRLAASYGFDALAEELANAGIEQAVGDVIGGRFADLSTLDAVIEQLQKLRDTLGGSNGLACV